MLLATMTRQGSSSIVQYIQEYVMIMHMLSPHSFGVLKTGCAWLAPAQLTMHWKVFTFMFMLIPRSPFIVYCALRVVHPVAEHLQPCWQVLGEVFNCLHRAQLGSVATSGVDPQLPQLVRVPRATSSSSLSGLATPNPHPHNPSSMAQDIFGQKVQVRDFCFFSARLLRCIFQAQSG